MFGYIINSAVTAVAVFLLFLGVVTESTVLAIAGGAILIGAAVDRVASEIKKLRKGDKSD